MDWSALGWFSFLLSVVGFLLSQTWPGDTWRDKDYDYNPLRERDRLQILGVTKLLFLVSIVSAIVWTANHLVWVW